ncbi:MAG: hypothetical protein V4506_11385 [Bacteroidota bacterium]
MPHTPLADQLTDAIRGFKAPDLAKYVFKNNIISELVNCALDKDSLLSSRAMWVLGHCSDLDYDSIKKYHGRLIKNLEQPGLHNGVIRNTLRLYQQHPIPEKHHAFLLDKCFSYIQDPSQAIAVRAFAMTIVFNISKPYPELTSELRAVLSHINIDEETPGIRSRVKNTIKAIDKLNHK